MLLFCVLLFIFLFSIVGQLYGELFLAHNCFIKFCHTSAHVFSSTLCLTVWGWENAGWGVTVHKTWVESGHAPISVVYASGYHPPNNPLLLHSAYYFSNTVMVWVWVVHWLIQLFDNPENTSLTCFLIFCSQSFGDDLDDASLFSLSMISSTFVVHCVRRVRESKIVKREPASLYLPQLEQTIVPTSCFTVGSEPKPKAKGSIPK